MTSRAHPRPAHRSRSAGFFFGAHALCTVLLAFALFSPLGVFAQSPAASPWDTAAEILARIKAPVFPDRDFVITDANYGALPGGAKHDASTAITRAIADCHAAGGGRVVIPAGTFLTGPIHLKSNVNLHLEKGATLLFKTDPAAYLPLVLSRWEGIECMNYSPLIYAYEQENIAVTGAGTLDGGASTANWWSWADKAKGEPIIQRASTKRLNDMSDQNVPVAERIFGAGHFLRPPFFQPYRCKNILIEGLTILRSPFWEITPVLCENVTVRGLNISTHGPNNDGCDPDSCRDVLIENCVFDTGDDCIAIKSGRNDDGRRVGVPAENHIIRGCTMKDGHGGVVIGSEIAGGCRNVFVENCTMDSPNLDRALRFKSNARRGGLIENIHMRNITIGQVAEAIITVDFMYEEGPNGTHAPILRNVSLENVTSKKSPRILYIASFPGATVDNIRIANSTFEGLSATELITHTGRIVFENVTALPSKKPKSLSSRPTTGD